jgi:hypothetical protein
LFSIVEKRQAMIAGATIKHQPKAAMTQKREAELLACHTNPNSLRRWAASFLKRGIAGLLENKRGHSGRKPK